MNFGFAKFRFFCEMPILRMRYLGRHFENNIIFISAVNYPI